MRRASFLAILVPTIALACSGGTAPVSLIQPGPNDSPGPGSDGPPGVVTPGGSAGSGIGVGSGSGSGSSGAGGGETTGGSTGVGASEPTCVNCAQKAFVETEDPPCEGNSSALYDDLLSCGCDLCGDVCGSDLCSGGAASSDCGTCLAQQCTDILQSCAQDPAPGG